MNYKLLNASEDAGEIDYAEFHELTVFTPAGADDTEKTAALKNQLAKNDIYYVATASIDDGVALTKIAKGDTTATYASANTYYTAAAEAVAKSAIDAAKLYMYGDENSTTAAKGKTAFRYIGKLSEAQDTWTKQDISKINVSYAITGVKGSTYDSIDTAGALTYGLYKDPSYLSSTTMTAANNSVTLSLPTGVTLTKVEAVQADGTGAVELNNSVYSLEGTTFTIVASNITTWAGMNPAYTKVVLTFSDNKTETITLQ